MSKSERPLGQQSHSSGRSSNPPVEKTSSPTASRRTRIVPPPISIPTRQHKSAAADDFEKGGATKMPMKQDYYEEIRKKPIKVLMTREISQYYGRETYLKTTIKEILIYILFLIILSMLVSETPSSDMQMLITSMANVFTDSTFTSTRTDIEMTFKDVTTTQDIWSYMDFFVTRLSSDFFFEVSSKNTGDDPGGNDFNENRLIGVPRIRSVRVKNESCSIVSELKQSYSSCYGYYSSSSKDRQPFGSMERTAWHYSPSENTGMHPVYGTVSTYGGGGYYQDFVSPADTTFKTVLKTLRKGAWINRGTRAVIVDFTVYNANVNLFCVMKILFEIPPTGGVIPSFIIHTIRLIGYGKKKMVLLGCTVLFIFFFVFYTVEELYEMTYFKWQFINSFWNFLDVSIVMMCYLVIATNLYQYVTARELLTNMDVNNSKYLKFDEMLYVQIICNVSLSLLVFFCWVKILKYVGINHSMYQLHATLQLAFHDIMWYSVIFGAVLFTFAFLGFLLFGDQLEFYSTIPESIWTFLRAGVGDFNYLIIERARPFLGPLFYFLALYFICYVFVVMYVAILLAQYAEVRSEITSSSAQMKLGDILQSWVVDLIGTFSLRLAARARDGFNRRKIRHKFQDVRYLLIRCGFTELEINMFLAKYEISEDRVMTEEDLRDIMTSFHSPGTTQLGIAQEMVRQSIAEKVVALEEAVDNVGTKISSIMEVLSVIEAKSKMKLKR